MRDRDTFARRVLRMGNFLVGDRSCTGCLAGDRLLGDLLLGEYLCLMGLFLAILLLVLVGVLPALSDLKDKVACYNACLRMNGTNKSPSNSYIPSTVLSSAQFHIASISSPFLVNTDNYLTFISISLTVCCRPLSSFILYCSPLTLRFFSLRYSEVFGYIGKHFFTLGEHSG